MNRRGFLRSTAATAAGSLTATRAFAQSHTNPAGTTPHHVTGTTPLLSSILTLPWRHSIRG